MKTTFYIFRHGETVAKKSNPPLVCGRLDSPLTREGKEQIREKIGVRIGGIHFNKAFLSPTVRSRESFDAVFSDYEGTLPSVAVVPELREVDYGEYDGKPVPEYEKAKKVWQDAGNILNFETKIGGAESSKEASERFSGALLKIARENLGQTVILPSHNAIMRSLFFLGKIQGVPEDLKIQGDLPFGCLLILESDGIGLEFKNFIR